MKYAVTCLVCLSTYCSFPLFSQQVLEEAIPYKNFAAVQTSFGYMEVSHSRKQLVDKRNPKKIYYSYYRDSVYATQGGYHGYLLHGIYIERYAHKGLKVLGNYAHGLRRGKWKYWDKRGMLRREERWRHGMLSGSFMVYGEDGSIHQTGYMSRDKYHGIVTTLQAGDSNAVEKKRYRRGKELAMGDGGWLGKAYYNIQDHLRQKAWKRN